MAYQENERFLFVSKALADDAFDVVSFSGTEALSQPYQFIVDLSSEEPDIDLSAVLRSPATLTMQRGDEGTPVHGVLAAFEQLHQANRRTFYRAVLVPRLWYLGMDRNSRVFLNKKVPEVIEEVLKGLGLASGQDYDISLTRTTYNAREYICQHQETSLAFLSRWMEREGIYYYFEQTDDGEKLIVTDSGTRHGRMPGKSSLAYSPASGLVTGQEECVVGLVCRQQVLPSKVVLRDYNYLTPSVDVKGEDDVDSKGRGEVYLFGEDFQDTSQGNDLAQVRAEEYLCRQAVWHGEATAPSMSPGCLFDLKKHYRDDFNQSYLITEVEHRGSQAGTLLAGLPGGHNSAAVPESGYSNRFSCIPSGVQFRPERTTPRPVVRGSQTAIVVGPSSEQVYTDEHGRVKVQFHWDRKGKKDENSSFWIRVSQLWAGAGWGAMHIPHIGQEVIVGFIEGDPDRPIVMGRVYNQENIPPLNKAPLKLPDNRLKSIIRDDHGNEMVFDSTPGASNIAIYNPDGHGIIKASSDNTYWTSKTDAGELFTGAKTAITGGIKSDSFLGSSSCLMAGFNTEFKLAASLEAAVGVATKIRYGPEYQIAFSDKVAVANEDWLQVAQGDAIIDSHGDNDGKIILVAGPKRQSVVEMGEYRLALSVGQTTRPDPTRSHDRQRKVMEGVMIGLASTAAITQFTCAMIALGAYAAMPQDESWAAASADNLNLGSSISSHAISLACSILANTLALIMYKDQLKPDQIKKEVADRKRNASIQMFKNGRIVIDSSANNQPFTVTTGGGQITLSARKSIQLMADSVRATNRFASKNILDMG